MAVNEELREDEEGEEKETVVRGYKGTTAPFTAKITSVTTQIAILYKCSNTTHLQHTSNTPPTHLQHTSNTPPTHLQHTSNTPPTHLQHTFNTPSTHLHNSPISSPNYRKTYQKFRIITPPPKPKKTFQTISTLQNFQPKP